MPLATFPDYAPSRASRPTTTFRVKKIKFRGYEQRQDDGLNSAESRWNLQFNLRPIAQIEAIETFLNDNKGKAFLWTPPRKTEKKWTCENYTGPDYVSDTHASIRCTLIEVFDV